MSPIEELNATIAELQRLQALADDCRSSLFRDFRHTAALATHLREAIGRELRILQDRRASEARVRRPRLQVVG